MRHSEFHRTSRTGWLRAAVLGANDGIVSTASLILGVAASGADTEAIAIAGFAALVAGAMSMGAGEYVSVSSQADTERADLARETKELAENPVHEHAELAAIYVQRGLDTKLASEVATQLMKHDALATHARDELGISEELAAKPLQATLSSAAAFAAGAALPLAILYVAPAEARIWSIAIASIAFLAALGYVAARTGSAPALKAVARVTFWGALAMSITALVGKLVGVSV